MKGMLVPSIGGRTNRCDAAQIVGWNRVGQQCPVFDGELLCVALGVVGLSAVNPGFCRSAGDYAIAAQHARLVSAGCLFAQGSPCGAPQVAEAIGSKLFELEAPLDSAAWPDGGQPTPQPTETEPKHRSCSAAQQPMQEQTRDSGNPHPEVTGDDQVEQAMS